MRQFQLELKLNESFCIYYIFILKAFNIKYFMKIFFGILIVILAILFESLWLYFCFQYIIIGILMLIFMRSILFFPFKIIFPIGLLLIFHSKIKNNSNYYRNSKFKNNKYESNLKKYYDILESKDSDNMSTIKSNYRRLIIKYHYDTNISKKLSKDKLEEAEIITKKLNEAYSIIKNIKKEKKVVN